MSCLKNKINSTELTFEERYPINYLFGPSDEDIKRLEKKIKKDEKRLNELPDKK